MRWSETFIIIAIMFIAVMGPSVVIAILGQAAIYAISRNPNAHYKILASAGILLLFMLVFSIIAILIIFQLFGR